MMSDLIISQAKLSFVSVLIDGDCMNVSLSLPLLPVSLNLVTYLGT